MLNNRLLSRCALAVSVACLAACAENVTQPKGDFSYLDQQSQEAFTVPEGLNTPRRNSTFHVPEIINPDSEFVGSNMNILPPDQVLTLAKGSLLPKGTRKAIIQFESPQADWDIRTQVWSALWQYLKDRDINARFWDKQGGVLMTDWFTHYFDEDPSTFFGLEDYFFERRGDIEIKTRYYFGLDVDETGRSAQLYAGMIGYEESIDGKLVKTEPNQVDRENMTVQFLNGAIEIYDREAQALQRDLARKQYKQIELQFEQRAGSPLIIAEAPFEVVWGRMENALELANFSVTDRDKSLGTYYVDYDEGFTFLGLFGRDKVVVEGLDEDNYEVQLGDRGEKTTINLFNDKNKPIRPAELKQVFEALQVTLSAAPQ